MNMKLLKKIFKSLNEKIGSSIIYLLIAHTPHILTIEKTKCNFNEFSHDYTCQTKCVQSTTETPNLTGNARNASKCFATILAIPGSDAATINKALRALESDDLQSAFGQMSPAPFSAPTNAQLLDAVSIRSTYSKHLQNFPLQKNQNHTNPSSLWGDGFVQWQEQSTLFGYSDTTLGTSVGIDYRIRNGIFGTAFSYTHDIIHAKDSAGKASLNSYYGGLYNRWNFNKIYIDTALIGAFNYYKTTREIHFGTVNRDARAQHSGSQWLMHGGLEYQVNIARFQWSLYINFDYVFQHEHGYTESGAESLNLHVYPENAMIIVTEGGFSLSANYNACKGIFTPTLTLACVNQTPCSSDNYHANFIDSCCRFEGNGGNYQQTLFAPSLALTYQGLNNTINISLYLDNQVGSNYWAQDIAFDLTYCF